MRVSVISVGKPRDRTIRDLIDHYLGRSAPLFRTRWIHVSEGDPRGSKLPERAVAAEGVRLLKHLDGRALNVALHERGKARTSRELARWMGQLRDRGQAVRFVIGGAHGLDPDVLSACPHRLTLSAMTLPHDLALLLLAEQIYRAKAILAGEPYHHG